MQFLLGYTRLISKQFTEQNVLLFYTVNEYMTIHKYNIPGEKKSGLLICEMDF